MGRMLESCSGIEGMRDSEMMAGGGVDLVCTIVQSEGGCTNDSSSGVPLLKGVLTSCTRSGLVLALRWLT